MDRGIFRGAPKPDKQTDTSNWDPDDRDIYIVNSDLFFRHRILEDSAFSVCLRLGLTICRTLLRRQATGILQRLAFSIRRFAVVDEKDTWDQSESLI